MQFAVATHSFLCLFSLDDQWDIDDFRLLNRGHHYGIGIDRDAGRMYAKVNDRALDTLTEEYVLAFDLDAPCEPVGRHRLRGWLNDVHQTAWANDGLYIANTAYNSVVYQSPQTGHFDEYFFDGVRFDKNHVNSVYPYGSTLFAVLHNTNTHGNSEIAQLHHRPGAGFQIENRVRLWHGGCHNVYLDPPYLLYNASNDGRFVAVDIDEREPVCELQFPGHTKGLSVTPEYVVLGHSDHAEREERPTSHGHFSVVDRSDWSRVADVDLNVGALPHPIGNVNEVRRLDAPDLAHAGVAGRRPPSIAAITLADASLFRRGRRRLDALEQIVSESLATLTGTRSYDP